MERDYRPYEWHFDHACARRGRSRRSPPRRTPASRRRVSATASRIDRECCRIPRLATGASVGLIRPDYIPTSAKLSEYGSLRIAADMRATVGKSPTHRKDTHGADLLDPGRVRKRKSYRQVSSATAGIRATARETWLRTQLHG